MTDWTVWATFLALGTGIAVVATYLICRARIEQTYARIIVLEREIALARLREEANEKKLTKILEAVTALREANDLQLSQLKARLDALLAEVASDSRRSAA
ncbi:MAG TPA: hypothetical protein VNO43_08830 [Candidatus Eisenbacteria bacterium]|nr:hypothetical protein [Candidatus Eisenbacteria bacterium]